MQEKYSHKGKDNFLILTLLAFNENGDLKAILKSCSSRPQVSLTRKYYLLFPEKKYSAFAINTDNK